MCRRYYLAGRNYHGPAIAPSTLSVYEQFAGVGKLHDPAADEEDRMRDLMEERGNGFNKGLTQKDEIEPHAEHPVQV